MADMEYAISMRYSDGHGQIDELGRVSREEADRKRQEYVEAAWHHNVHHPACGATEINVVERPIGSWTQSR